jgi:two-component system OmpR family response regulator/two-component system response regulator QseB
MRILLIEDDPMIGESLEEGLRQESYVIDWVRDASSSELALKRDVYDLILLDLGLPGGSGLDVLTRYRRRDGAAPVLILSARDGKGERVAGLDAGADDYLVKPFDLDELYARIRALLRRRAGRTSPKVVYRGIVLDPARHSASFQGQDLQLTRRQFVVLYALMDPPGDVVTREQLEDKLYGWKDGVESNTVDVFIHHLRKKLGSSLIKNVRGVGYRLADEEPDSPDSDE